LRNAHQYCVYPPVGANLVFHVMLIMLIGNSYRQTDKHYKKTSSSEESQPNNMQAGYALQLTTLAAKTTRRNRHPEFWVFAAQSQSAASEDARNHGARVCLPRDNPVLVCADQRQPGAV
jgi:hypothetical protein